MGSCWGNCSSIWTMPQLGSAVFAAERRASIFATNWAQPVCGCLLFSVGRALRWDVAGHALDNSGQKVDTMGLRPRGCGCLKHSLNIAFVPYGCGERSTFAEAA